MKKARQDISSDSVVDVTVPESWEQLSQEDLCFALRLLASDIDPEACRSSLLCRFAGMKVIGLADSSRFLVRLKGVRVPALVSVEELALVWDLLQWFHSPPKSPVRPDCIGKGRALHPRLSGVPFESYLALESFFQGFIHTQDEALVREMVKLLYPGINPNRISRFAVVAAFTWFAGLKAWLEARYPDFFLPAVADSGLDDPEPPDMAEVIRVQVRALTKGDVTKIGQVLKAELHDALHELNSLAREYEKIKSQQRKS